MLNLFMDQLSKELPSIEVLKSEKGDAYTLGLGMTEQISLRENEESGITMQMGISPLPDEEREAFLVKLMGANLFGKETGGAAFGINISGKEVVLVRALPSKIPYRDFYAALEDFVNYGEVWQQEARLLAQAKGSS